MARVHVITVGGFLGAGKTTLLGRAAACLAGRGRRVGLVTNDQASQLVDSRVLARAGVDVAEVAGGCFCCRFDDLESSVLRLLDASDPEVVLCEPVGTCTDISATVLQPMKQRWRDWADVAPYSVLADPRRLREALHVAARVSDADGILYIIAKQFEEADLIVINKADLLSARELAQLSADAAAAWPRARVFWMSALANDGVEAWVDAVLEASDGGATILDLDYDRYAAGEAEMAWLNASVALTGSVGTEWQAVALDAMRLMQDGLARSAADVGHVKLLLSSGSQWIEVSLTHLADPPAAIGSLTAGTDPVTMVVNARARTGPEELETIVRAAVERIGNERIHASVLNCQSFRPAYPEPTHRVNSVVSPANTAGLD